MGTESSGFLVGTVLDEGTEFSPPFLTSERELRDFITGVCIRFAKYWATVYPFFVFFFRPSLENWIFYKPAATLPSALDTLLRHYPDIPSLGSPYPSPSRPAGSWDDNSRLFKPLESNQYKRTSSIFGDLIFESGRRAQLDDIAHAGVPVWNYRFMQPNPDRPITGTPHSSEIPYGECVCCR